MPVKAGVATDEELWMVTVGMILSDLSKRALATLFARTVGSDGRLGGGLMDPLVLAATSASIVDALATDGWQNVRDRMLDLFRHAQPDEVDDVSAELEEARELILTTQDDDDARVEHELTVTLQRRLQDLTRDDSSVDQELHRLLGDLLVSSRNPSLSYQPASLLASWDPSVSAGIPMPMSSGTSSTPTRLAFPAGAVAPAPASGRPEYTVFDRLGTARMLPRDVPAFTGREEEMSELLEAVPSGDEPSVYLLHGMPGAGKTALAVHTAHRVSESFPDGQLFINLRGHDPGDDPASPFQLLGTLLTAAGFPHEVQPESVHGRAGLWRSWLSSKRMMILLDDAADFGQVEPLLPGYPGCLTIVTSRLRLESAEVTKSIAVNELAPDLSVQLFERLLRRRGPHHDADNVYEVATLCGNLPLALVFAASVLLAHPTWQVPHLVNDLSSAPRRLTRLAGARASIAEVLNTSVRTLDEPEQRFLRRLGMHPGPELERRAAAVLANTSVEDADRCLDSLYRHNLLTEVSPGRFRMHVLLSSHCRTAPAAEFADEASDADTGDEEEVQRLLIDYYQRTATAAYLLVTRQESAETLQSSLPELAPPLGSPPQAAAWLATELDNLAACTQYSADHPEAVADLVTVVVAYLLRRGDTGITTARELVQVGRRRVTSRGDVRAEALFTHLSGLLALAENNVDSAVSDLSRAARISRADGWTAGAARALYGLHLALGLKGRFDDASVALKEAAEAFARAGDREGLDKARTRQALVRARSVHRLPAPGESEHRTMRPYTPGVLEKKNFLTQLETLILQMNVEHSESAGLPAKLPRTVHHEPDEIEDGRAEQSGAGGDGGGWEPPPESAGFPDEDDQDGADDQADGESEYVLPIDELDAVDAQHINFWFTDDGSNDGSHPAGESRIGCFQIGPDHPENLAAGERVIPPDQVPPEGLETHWIVSSSTCELSLPEGSSQQSRVSVAVGGDSPQWNFEFDLLIPAHGESEERLLAVTPQQAGTARIDAVVMVDGDPYRELTIEFPVEDPVEREAKPETNTSGETASSETAQPGTAEVPSQRPPAITDTPAEEKPAAGHHPRVLWPPRQRHHGAAQVRVRKRVPARETALRAPANWQRESGRLCLWVNAPGVWWRKSQAGVPGELSDTTFWKPSNTASQRIRAAQEALDAFWQARAQRYNSISPSDVAERLKRFRPRADWTVRSQLALQEDELAWNLDAHSEEMRDLARAGQQLFSAMFPEGSPLNALVKDLAPGDKLTIYWQDCVPEHVPWPLLFRGSLPRPGEPVNADDFLGLRLRISHVVRSCETTRSLDDKAVRAHLMYWGGQVNDETFSRSQEHAQELANWGPTILPTGAERRKEQLSDFLWDPAPVSLIYVFCQGSTGADNQPRLQFGSTNAASDILKLTDIGDAPFVDQPLVFLNACDTSAADHTYSNELQNSFLQRGSRAYIGSECKVPTSFAARFANVFFHFLYGRNGGGAPTAAGEALVQARKFFWDEYRSVGGLFYSYVNDYQVYIASPGEVAAMHRPTRQTRVRQQ
ncbi:CHAT domain-containing protein [Streptomyces sp. NPDC058611]|uniref:CHAT domain-containing protein n=1 Tax=unclassified Streptomyces TaxID=2593676 RepID=UPI00365B284B